MSSSVQADMVRADSGGDAPFQPAHYKINGFPVQAVGAK